MADLNQHLLNAKESKLLADHYENSNYSEINSKRPAGKPDSRFYSIELDVLKEYLKMIESEMDKKGFAKKGVRITLGKYPEKSNDPKINSKYLGYQTIFFSAVDLDHSSENKSLVGNTSNEVNAEEIPDMNYMYLTPPY